jgi:hypothetical protein
MGKAKWILPVTLLLAGGILGYARWVYQRTEGIYTGISAERIKYAHISDADRDRMTCLGAHGRKDLAEGHPRSFCVPIYKKEGLLR